MVLEGARRGRRRSSVHVGNNEALIALRKGAPLIKYGRHGKPHVCLFKLSGDEKELEWQSKKGSMKSVSFLQVTSVVQGHHTDIFRKQALAEEEPLSLSLLYTDSGGKSRSLDLVCQDHDQLQLWVTGLGGLVQRWVNWRKGTSPAVLGKILENSSEKGDFTPQDAGSEASSPDTARSKRSQWGATSQNLSPASSTRTPPVVGGGQVSGRASGVLGVPVSEPPPPGDLYIFGKGTRAALVEAAMDSAPAENAVARVLKPALLRGVDGVDIRAVSCSDAHGAVLTSGGEVYTWGTGAHGRLGHGTGHDCAYPELVDSLLGQRVCQVACGGACTAAVVEGGLLYTWGDNSAGMLGHAQQGSAWSPMWVHRGLYGMRAARVACGRRHIALTTADGGLYTWGDGSFGALGHGECASRSAPARVRALDGLFAAWPAAGMWHSAAVVLPAAPASLEGGTWSEADSPGGQVYTWGSGDKGQLGLGGEVGLEPAPRAVAIPELEGGQGIRQVECGLTHTLALSTHGAVFFWGKDGGGGGSKKAPVRVTGSLHGIKVNQIACGDSHCAALGGGRSQLFTWGEGLGGRLGHNSERAEVEAGPVSELIGRSVIHLACGASSTAVVCEHQSLTKEELKEIKKEAKERRKMLGSQQGGQQDGGRRSGAGPGEGTRRSSSAGEYRMRSTSDRAAKAEPGIEKSGASDGARRDRSSSSGQSRGMGTWSMALNSSSVAERGLVVADDKPKPQLKNRQANYLLQKWISRISSSGLPKASAAGAKAAAGPTSGGRGAAAAVGDGQGGAAGTGSGAPVVARGAGAAAGGGEERERVRVLQAEVRALEAQGRSDREEIATLQASILAGQRREEQLEAKLSQQRTAATPSRHQRHRSADLTSRRGWAAALASPSGGALDAATPGLRSLSGVFEGAGPEEDSSSPPRGLASPGGPAAPVGGSGDSADDGEALSAGSSPSADAVGREEAMEALEERAAVAEAARTEAEERAAAAIEAARAGAVRSERETSALAQRVQELEARLENIHKTGSVDIRASLDSVSLNSSSLFPSKSGQLPERSAAPPSPAAAAASPRNPSVPASPASSTTSDASHQSSMRSQSVPRQERGESGPSGARADSALRERSSSRAGETTIEVEPGVFVSTVELPDGRRELRRMRFSQKRFRENDAQTWWEANSARIIKQFNITTPPPVARISSNVQIPSSSKRAAAAAAQQGSVPSSSAAQRQSLKSPSQPAEVLPSQ